MAAANRVAHVLVEDLGIVPGNRVLLRGPNNQWLAAAWFGVLKAGAVAVTTMPLLRTGELETIHEIAHLDAALVDHRFLDAVEPLGLLTIGFGDDAWLDRLAAKPATFDDVLTSSDDVSMLAFTSGTTGRPKATMHFHRDLLAVCDTFSATCSSRRPTTSSPARRPSRSPSGWAASCSSPSMRAPRRCWWRRRHRRSSPT